MKKVMAAFFGRYLKKQAGKMFSGYEPRTFKLFSGNRRGTLKVFRTTRVQGEMFTSDKQNKVPARLLNDQPANRLTQRRLTLLKRVLMATAGCLFAHFLIVDYREKKRRRGTPERLKPPYEAETIYDKDLNRKFTVINGYLLPDFVSAKTYEEIVNFRVHPEDVYVVSFPKSGTFARGGSVVWSEATPLLNVVELKNLA